MPGTPTTLKQYNQTQNYYHTYKQFSSPNQENMSNETNKNLEVELAVLKERYNSLQKEKEASVKQYADSSAKAKEEADTYKSELGKLTEKFEQFQKDVKLEKAKPTPGAPEKKEPKLSLNQIADLYLQATSTEHSYTEREEAFDKYNAFVGKLEETKETK